MDELSKRIAALSPAKRAILQQRLQAKGMALESKVISRRAPSATAPLSFAQERLWFLDQLEPDSCAYNIPQSHRLAGALDIDALQLSFQEIVRRHEVLRTTFQSREGKPFQVTTPAAAFDLSRADLSSLSNSERTAELARLTTEHLQQPFHLANEPLLRARLVRLSADDHVLLLNMHHIVSDGWSMGIFYRELSALYTAFQKGKKSNLPELSIQYADYAVWQREWLKGAELERQLAYWRKQLANAPTLELPTDRPRPPQQTYTGAQQTIHFSTELSAKLKAFNRREGTTPFMSLLAAFQVLLARYCGQKDLVVGTPIANRQHVELEPLIGFFANTLALRADLSGNPGFREIVGRAKHAVLEAHEHQDLPFEKLVEALHSERDLSRHPIFQVMFTLQNEPEFQLILPGLETAPYPLPGNSTHFELELYLWAKDEGWAGVFTYNTDLFDAATVERMAGHFLTLLAAMLTEPELPVLEAPMLTSEERHQLLVEWNDTRREYPRDKCLHELFEAQVERSPDAVAVVFEDQRLTYRELNQRSNQLAHHLKALGVGPDVLVGICVERSLEMVIGLLGSLKAGGAWVPLDPAYPEDRLAVMVQDSQMSVLITQGNLLRLCSDLKAEHLSNFGISSCKLFCLDTARVDVASLSENNPRTSTTGQNLAYVIFTSGSTGKPKGVMVEHHSIVNHLSWRQQTFPLGSKDRFLQKASLSFDISVWEIFAPLISGAQLVLAKPDGQKDPAYLVQLMAERIVTTAHCGPALLQALVDEPGFLKCTSLRRVFCGGEPLSGELQSRFFDRSKAELISQYGPTETTVDVTWCRCDRVDRLGVAPLGRPIANTQVYILDTQLNLVPAGVPGELHIGGLALARGYLNQPDMTAEKFVPNPFDSTLGTRLYKTGDLCRYQADGNIEFLGRADQQVKIRGFRIELGEIEALLTAYPNIQGSVVMAREDRAGDKMLVAYLMAREDLTPKIPELREFLKKKLADYMIPAAFVTLSVFPLTPNGKIDRKALRECSPVERDSQHQVVRPRNPAELQLAPIWERILGVQNISVDDNFFDLGGHSLMAVRLASEINKSLNVSLSIPTLFQNPTIGRLANVLEHEIQCQPRLIPLQPGRSAGTLFLLDASMGMCRLTNLLNEGLASFATIVPFSPEVIQAATLNNTDNLPTVEDMAAAHVALIRSHSFSGPCLLAGHSFDGLLAFEVAHQLQRDGRQVEMVVLLDSWRRLPSWWNKLKILSPTRVRESVTFRTGHWWLKMQRRIVQATSRFLSVSKSCGAPQFAFEEANQPIGNVPWETLERIYRNARKNYHLRPLQCRAALFRAQDSDEAHLYAADGSMGWHGLFTRGLEIVDVPGDHLSLLKNPHMLTLAQRMNEQFDQLHPL